MKTTDKDKIRTILKDWLQGKDFVVFTDDIAIEAIVDEIASLESQSKKPDSKAVNQNINFLLDIFQDILNIEARENKTTFTSNEFHTIWDAVKKFVPFISQSDSKAVIMPTEEKIDELLEIVSKELFTIGVRDTRLFYDKVKEWFRSQVREVELKSMPETIVGVTKDSVEKFINEEKQYYGAEAIACMVYAINWYRSQLKTVNKDDLIQYITNLLYAAYTHETDSSKFDKWLEEQMKNIDDYLSGKGKEGK